jgi:hypothetical protein
MSHKAVSETFLDSSNPRLGPTSPGSLNEKSSKPEVSAAEIGPTEPAEVKSATTGVVTSAGVAVCEVHVAATGV